MPGRHSVLGKRKQRDNTEVQEDSKSSTLFVSNLPYNVTSTEVQTLFSDFGPVRLAFVVCEDGKSKGVGYVSFAIKEDASSAMERIVKEKLLMNGRKLRVQWAERRKSKDSRPASKKPKSGDKPLANVQLQSNPEPEDEPEVSAEETDDAVPAKVAMNHAEEDDEMSEVVDGGDDDDDDNDHDGSEGGDTPSHSSSQKDDVESELESDGEPEPVSEEDEERRPRKAALPSTDEGTTIFVRNVPFDATEDEIRQLFRTFGPLRYARITVDTETGRSRGTAFVCFWKKEDAEKCIRQSELLNRETVAQQQEQHQQSSKKKNPFSMPSLLTPDPSSSLAQSLVLHGRALNITRALSRDAATRLAEEGLRSREKRNIDKRNTYLLREGVIFPNSPAAAALPDVEVEKRQASYTTRCRLLKSNPVLYVSKTRLSVRQLPLFASEHALKQLASYAIKTFEEDVKNGKREPLSAEELREDIPFDEGTKNGDGQVSASKKPKARKKGRLPRKESPVMQAKIVRQADRVDRITGKGRSRGYAFLEMRSHADALRVLRYANNNPDVLPLLVGWWSAELRGLIQHAELDQAKAGTTANTKTKPKPKHVRKTPGSKVVDHAGNEEAEDDAAETRMARLNRMKVELEELESSARHQKTKNKSGTLICEFSVENAQVVKRRREKQRTQKQTDIA